MEELDLKELLQVFWEKKVQIILITAIFIALGIIYTIGFVTPKYESTTKLLLATNSSSQASGTESITTSDVTLNSKLVSTYSELVTSERVIRSVKSTLGIDDDETSLKKNISVTAVSDTEVIKISVKNEDPVVAAKIANEIAKALIENVKLYYGVENVHVVDAAEVAENPCNVNHVKDVIIFAFIGFVIAIMYVLVANMLDTTIKSAEDIEKAAGVTVLASIPVYEIIEEKSKNKRKQKRKGGV